MSSTNPNPKEAPKQPRSYAELPRNCAELPRNCPELPRNCPELPRNCPELEPLLTAYALEELAPEEREEVAAHLAGCGPCREELDMLARAATLVAKSAPAAAALGAAARGRILEAAGAGGGAGGPPRRGRGPLWRWIGGLAAAAVVVAGVVVFWQVQALREREAAQRDLAMAKAVRSLEPPALEARPTPAALAPRPAASPEPSASPAADPAPQAGAEVVKAESAALPADEARDRSLFRARGLREENRKQVDLLLADKAKQVELPLDRFEKREADGAEGRRLLESLSVTRLQDDLGGTRGEATPRYGSVDGLKKLKKDAADARGGVALQPAKEAKPVQLVAGPAPGPRPNGAALVEGLAEAPAREREVEAALRTRAGSAGPPPAAKPAELAAAGQRAEKEKAREYKRGRADAAAEPPAEPAAAPVPGGAVAVQEAARPAPSPEGRAAAPGEAGAPSGIAGGAGRGGGEGAAALGGPGAAAPDPASTAPAETRSWRTRVDEILSKLDRRPGETPDMMFFRYWGSNPFVEASSDPLSTFAVDVDTASYTVLRAYLLQRNLLPPREAIRTEELVNYFDQRYAPPPEGGPAFAVHVEVAPSPFAHEQAYKLLRVGLKGREVSREKRKAASLVFVIDTSGSMRRENRLELAKDALRLLVNELDEGDSIGIVAFDREARTILEPTAASEKERILDAIGTLLPRQNTNVAAGLELGYRMANARLLKDGTNRVILISDGVANTGVTDPDAMLERVRAERERGIYLTSVGVGMGNLNDALLERLADRGNGQCVYVDRLEEARKAFVEGLTGTLEAIAKDVKIQVELDPKQVLRYRLLGYENRDVADSAFRDNKVDAGEVGAGHEVTALYELKLREDVPPPAQPAAQPAQPAAQPAQPAAQPAQPAAQPAQPGAQPAPAGAQPAPGVPPAPARLATVRVRYLTVDHGEAVEIEQPVTAAAVRPAFDEASPRFQTAACAAELAEVLRDSFWARGSSLDRVAAMLAGLLERPEADGKGKLGDDQDLVELLALTKRADALVRLREGHGDEIARVIDSVKDNFYLQARVEDQIQSRSETNREALEEIRRQQEELRRRLESLLAR